MIHRIQVIDWLSRKRVWEQYLLYKKTQWYSAAEMERFQTGKLRALLRHCVKHVPFYRDVINGAAIDVDQVRSLKVLEQFPVIDKATVGRDRAAFTSTTARGLAPMRIVHTGGTTGEPLFFYKDAGLRSSSHAAFYRFQEWMGVSVADAKIRVWGAPIVRSAIGVRLRDYALRLFTNTANIDPFLIGPGVKETLRAVFLQHRPVLVYGYCQAIYEMARWFEEWGVAFPLRAVSTTVEPLFAEYRNTFRRVFGCEAFDLYGCSEVEIAAGECSSHEGLHVIQERTVLEVDGKSNVVLTDLDNRAFPFIRYRNGDMVELKPQGCSCGRAGPMLQRVLGRTGDVITGMNGNRVHPEFFTHLINELGISYRTNLRRYQVVQDRIGHLEWRLVSSPLSEEDRQKLVAKVRHHLGDIDVDLVYVHDIPPTGSGKFQYVVSRL